MKDLRERVHGVVAGATELRHALHRIPEVHMEENLTSELLRERLAGRGLEILPPYMGTDVVAILRGGSPGRNVTLRADIDALPVNDASGAAWCSTRPGFSHACGHDGHMAMLMGAIEVLCLMRAELRGSVRFVFQPAEEEAGGGRTLVRKGILEQEPEASAAFALHGWPGIALGALSSLPGVMMAAADRFVLRVTGKGSHGARPHAGVDPVVTAAELVVALQSVVSRSIDPMSPAVLSVCSIHGGHTSNVIPEEVVMEGTTRCFDPAVGEEIHGRMETIARGVCQAAGASYRLDFDDGYIPLTNNPEMVTLARQAVIDALGQDAWVDGLLPTMGGEDFAYYLERVPGALLRLGLGEEHPGLHSPAFDFDDRAIEPGITALCAVTLAALDR